MKQDRTKPTTQIRFGQVKIERKNEENKEKERERYLEREGEGGREGEGEKEIIERTEKVIKRERNGLVKVRKVRKRKFIESESNGREKQSAERKREKRNSEEQQWVVVLKFL